MAERVKSKRRYESPRRREQAAATRQDILEAAQRLFERQGYAATTMAAIAAEAGVALKTVYIAFETKSGVLRAVWNLLLRGGEGDAPVADRPWFLEALDEPDAKAQLRLVARYSRAVKERSAAIFEVIQEAAATDPDAKALWDRIQTEFHATQGKIVVSLADKGALKPGLEVERGADLLWALNHPSLWQLLVVERGWSVDDYEQWFADTVCEQLLDPAIRSRAAAARRR